MQQSFARLLMLVRSLSMVADVLIGFVRHPADVHPIIVRKTPQRDVQPGGKLWSWQFLVGTPPVAKQVRFY